MSFKGTYVVTVNACGCTVDVAESNQGLNEGSGTHIWNQLYMNGPNVHTSENKQIHFA